MKARTRNGDTLLRIHVVIVCGMRSPASIVCTSTTFVIVTRSLVHALIVNNNSKRMSIPRRRTKQLGLCRKRNLQA